MRRYRCCVASLLADLATLTTDCWSASEYLAARAEWLHAHVDCEAIYQGAVLPSANFAPSVTGVEPRQTKACEASVERYWSDRTRLNRGAEDAGGIAIDIDVLDARARDRSEFYHEVMNPMGFRSTAVVVLKLRGTLTSAIWLGRCGRGRRARFRSPAAMRVLREALPLLVLGDAIHPPVAGAPPDLGLTRREREIVFYVERGLTNTEIARLCGTAHATVKNQIASILRKVGASNRTELVGRLRPLD